MIQAIRETNFDAYINTEANRINTSVTSAHIRHLVKFINENVHDRYTQMGFIYNATPNRYIGRLNLIPAGYYKYELYEVSWIGVPSLNTDTAPATETDVLLPIADTKGVVEGLVAIGKLYLGEKSGSEEVQYTEYTQPASTNTIYYGQ